MKKRRRRRVRERTRGRIGPTLLESIEREPVAPPDEKKVAIVRAAVGS